MGRSGRLRRCDESGFLFGGSTFPPPVFIPLMGSATLAQYSMPYCILRKVILREGDKKRRARAHAAQILEKRSPKLAAF